MQACLNCGEGLVGLVDDIRDWEYGVDWRSKLVICPSCGLVTQDPPVRSEQIELLYPDNYVAHSAASRSRSVYGRLKAVLGRRSAQGVAQHIPPGGSCLEVGCGNGSFLAVLGEVRSDIQLAGVDIADLHVTDVPRFTFYRGQLEDVDFGGRRFDVIYCSNLIEHVPDPFRFLRKCASILAPGGVIYGITPDHLSVDRLLWRRYWAGYHYPRHTFVFNHHNMRRILEKCGFESLQISGSYGFWYLSFANRFVSLPGTKKRGLLFAAVTALFLPFDLVVNLFRCHGSMKFVARLPA
ncbi:MAG TPA: class I SAM-dependent methyltransferase [Kofleriaceae bacterium]|nr:class I SAM-dependent methyltransferase [Kofleriaceae bacterium]